MGIDGQKAGDLTLTRAVVSDNHAAKNGGGIYVSTSVTAGGARSRARLFDTILTRNSADASGGGISSNGDVDLTRTAVKLVKRVRRNASRWRRRVPSRSASRLRSR